MDRQTQKLLRTIPGVGPSLAQDLWDIGVRTLEDIAARDPQEMYETLCCVRGVRQDRCVLYVFACAAYFASTPADKRDPDKLLWWNWKNM